MRFRFRTYSGRHAFVRDARGDRPLSLLDVGNLGDGESTCALLKKDVETRGGTYTGLDSNAPLTRKLNLPNQVVGDLHDAPFSDNTFDALYAGEIIEHTWTPGRMVAECRRILKPGGRLILDTPNPYSITAILRFLLYREDSMGDNRRLTYEEARDSFKAKKAEGDMLLQPQHKIFFTPAMLKQLLETHGYVVETMGVVVKPRGLVRTILIKLFPQTGQNLCCIARKATVEDAFTDIRAGS